MGMTNKFKNNIKERSKKKMTYPPDETTNSEMDAKDENATEDGMQEQRIDAKARETPDDIVDDIEIIPDSPSVEEENDKKGSDMAHWAGTYMVANRFLDKTRKKNDTNN